MTKRGRVSEVDRKLIADNRRVSVQVAADLLGISSDTFRKEYRDLLIRVSERRLVVKLDDVLALGTPAD